jgi:hypothetical protein
LSSSSFALISDYNENIILALNLMGNS